jgi:hypothetical protein
VTKDGPIPFDDGQVARQQLRDAGYECDAANPAAGTPA